MKGFEMLKQLGKGAFGSVFLVKRKEDNQIYALKRVFLDKLNKKEQDNSINEVRLLASINHANIIGYKESMFDDATKCLNIVMEYADDGDLQSKIEYNKKNNLMFDEEIVWSYAIQMVRGLKALHDCKIMHRDLKTANIFLMKNGVCKLGDLNVSKVVKMGMLRTQTGTPYYASPEVWNDKPYSYKSDLWSIGCVIYELCTMKVPFKGKNMDDLYKTVCKGKYEPLSNVYSQELCEIVSLLLKVNPNDRPSCEQFLSHSIIKRRIIIGRMIENDDAGYNAHLLGTIKFRDIKEIKKKLPKKNYDDLHEYIDNDKEGNISANLIPNQQRSEQKPHSYHSSSIKANYIKPQYENNHNPRSKTPTVNKKAINQKDQLSIKKQLSSGKDNIKYGKGIQRPMSNKQMKPLYKNQKINSDNQLSHQRPASANPTSIKKRNMINQSNNRQQQSNNRDRPLYNKVNKSIGGNVKCSNLKQNGYHKQRPLSSNPTNHKINTPTIQNNYNNNVCKHDSFVQVKSSQNTFDPDHKILVNPIRIVEPSGNMKSYQYKINYSTPNSILSTNQTTNQNPNSFLKRNVQVNVRNNPNSSNLLNSSHLLNNNQKGK